MHTLAAGGARALPAYSQFVRPRPPLGLACSQLVASPLRCASSLSLSVREKAVLRLLQAVRHPSAPSGEDIVFSGHVRSVSERDGVVSIVLPLDEQYRALKKTITERLEAPGNRPEWMQGVRVVMEAAKDSKAEGSSRSASAAKSGGDGLAHVRHIIAVSSCKLSLIHI